MNRYQIQKSKELGNDPLIMKYSKEWLTIEETDRLFSHPEISSRNLLLMKTCYYGALRIGEALNSKREDYREGDYYYLLLREQKTDKKNWESQPIPKSLFGDIKRYCDDNKIRFQDFVFQSSWGNKLSYNMAYKAIKKAITIVGINKQITTHSFRRSRATHCFNEGWDIFEVATLLRHKKIETTQRYLKIGKKQLSNKLEETDMKLKKRINKL